MAVTNRALSGAAWLWKKIRRRPVITVIIVIVLFGGLHINLGNRAGRAARGAVGPADGSRRRADDGVQRSPAQQKFVSSEIRSSLEVREKRVECSNSSVFPFKPGCLLHQATDLDAGHPKIHRNKLKSKKHAPFPWPERENLMPNYFLNADKSASKVSSTSPDRSVLVFLHHNKAAGTTTKECLRTVVKATGRELGHVLNNDGRIGLMLNLRKLRRRRKRIPDTYYGGYAFGVCDELDRPCSYFTVLRDPYKRTLSSYSYCKTARSDQLCTALHAEKVTLREWALHQGSFFFRQLIFHPEFCSDKNKWIPFVDLDGEPHEFDGSQNALEDATCWFRQKLIMSLTLNRTEHDALLKYCLNNLEKWFKVIMLVDEFDLSLAMMERAYKLPFHKLCSGLHANIGTYDRHSNSSSTVKDNVASLNSSSLSDSAAEGLLRELMEDPEVRDALRADMMIFQKGVDIFKKQKDIFFEK